MHPQRDKTNLKVSSLNLEQVVAHSLQLNRLGQQVLASQAIVLDRIVAFCLAGGVG